MIGCILLITLILLTLAIDFGIQFNTWQSRIHIGRWKDRDTWTTALSTKSLLWLKKTPTIKLTDNDRLIIVDIIKGNYKRDAIQHWQEAAILLGLVQQFEKTRDQNIREQINTFISSRIETTGNWKTPPQEIDAVILGYAILNTPWVDHQKNRPTYDALWQMCKALIGDDGTVQYRKHMKNYRYVDTIGFICPFLIAYGTRFDKSEAIDLSLRQIAEFNKYGMYPSQFIPCHTYQVETKIPVGLFGWGRGLGWYAIGLIDAWNELPNHDPRKPDLTRSVISFANMAMRFQNDNGSWPWIVTSKETRADSSATATLAYFLANASKIDAIKDTSTSSKEKALDYLKKVTRRDGAIDFSQGDTKGIGVHSQHYDVLPFTQGFCLRTIFKD